MMEDHTWNGYSIYKYPNGDIIEGECSSGLFIRGTYTWKDLRRYNGEVLDLQANGQGIHHWPDGSHYIGQWKQMKRHGQGIMVWADGRKWVGTWNEDERGKTKDQRKWDGFFLLSRVEMQNKVKELCG